MSHALIFGSKVGQEGKCPQIGDMRWGTLNFPLFIRHPMFFLLVYATVEEKKTYKGFFLGDILS